MSKAIVVDEATRAADNEFIEQRKQSERYIKRHSLQSRVTHGVTAICCIWLMISGCFVFIPALAQAVGSGVVFGMRMSHRVIGCVFVIVPLISAILAPKGVAHIWKNNVCKWNSDDKLWMKLFMPYLFMAKYIHMPDQDEQKSGQRFADGMLWLSGFAMAITGIVLLLGETCLELSTGVHGVFLFLHDLFFVIMAIFACAHIFLGGGIFQPYRGIARVMWTDGLVSESDAMYHWGHWARQELESGEKVVEK